MSLAGFGGAGRRYGYDWRRFLISQLRVVPLMFLVVLVLDYSAQQWLGGRPISLLEATGWAERWVTTWFTISVAIRVWRQS